MSFSQLCRQMRIAGGPDEELRPLNIGLMLFNDQPERFFPGQQIDVVQFPDGLGGDEIREKIFRGPLLRQLRDALYYIKSQIIIEIVRKRPNRAEADRFYNYPYEAVEEALVNATYHRSYESREPIEVRVLPDQIQVHSFPGPDRSIQMKDLATGRAVVRTAYRNRRLGEYLKELDLTEGRGTGIPKILRNMRQNGSPTPKFVTDRYRTSFAVVLPIHPEAYVQHSEEPDSKVPPEYPPSKGE